MEEVKHETQALHSARQQSASRELDPKGLLVLGVIACVGSPQSVSAKTVAHHTEYVFLEDVFVHPFLGNI